MKIKNNLKILLPILAVVIFGIIFLLNFVNKSVIDVNNFSFEDSNSYVEDMKEVSKMSIIRVTRRPSPRKLKRLKSELLQRSNILNSGDFYVALTNQYSLLNARIDKGNKKIMNIKDPYLKEAYEEDLEAANKESQRWTAVFDKSNKLSVDLNAVVARCDVWIKYYNDISTEKSKKAARKTISKIMERELRNSWRFRLSRSVFYKRSWFRGAVDGSLGPFVIFKNAVKEYRTVNGWHLRTRQLFPPPVRSNLKGYMTGFIIASSLFAFLIFYFGNRFRKNWGAKLGLLYVAMLYVGITLAIVDSFL